MFYSKCYSNCFTVQFSVRWLCVDVLTLPNVSGTSVPGAFTGKNTWGKWILLGSKGLMQRLMGVHYTIFGRWTFTLATLAFFFTLCIQSLLHQYGKFASYSWTPSYSFRAKRSPRNRYRICFFSFNGNKQLPELELNKQMENGLYGSFCSKSKLEPLKYLPMFPFCVVSVAEIAIVPLAGVFALDCLRREFSLNLLLLWQEMIWGKLYALNWW